MDFLGAPYPITKTPRGLLPTQEGLNQVKSDLLCLLLTNPGERVMLPTYGTPLKQLVFDQNDQVLAAAARDMIIQSISTWEPRITVEQIDVTTISSNEESLNPSDFKQDLDHIMLMRILFHDPEDIKSIQELKLELPLAQGG